MSWCRPSRLISIAVRTSPWCVCVCVFVCVCVREMYSESVSQNEEDSDEAVGLAVSLERIVAFAK